MDEGWQEALVDQVIGYGGEAEAGEFADEALAVLPDHEGGGHVGVDAGGGVGPVVVLHAGVDFAGEGVFFAEFAVRDAGLGVGVGVVADGVATIAEGFAGGIELVLVEDAGAHFGEEHPVGGVYGGEGFGGLLVDGDCDGGGGGGEEEIVLAPDGDLDGGGHFGDALLHRGAVRAFAGGFETFSGGGSWGLGEEREGETKGREQWLHNG